VGQSTAYCFDLMYMTLLLDIPTAEDKSCYVKNVRDSLETIHDVLYPQSASAECFYQMSRHIGNITYPAGSEIRFSCRAWINYGMVPEGMWHTDKVGLKVWMYPPGPRPLPDGGSTPEEAAVFAAKHRAEGYAQVGTVAGSPTWEQVCSAIANKGFVLGAIPIYENYATMQGGDGSFPDPKGELAGFHALCFYGYDQDNLYLVHSWGDWCGMYGSLSRQFFQTTIDLIQFFTILDANEVAIARGAHGSIEVTSNVPAVVTVDGRIIGNTPQKVSLVKGQTYQITVSADGYIAQTKMVTDGAAPWGVTLVPTAQPVKSWFQILIEWLTNLYKRIANK
jgi:hypothetical protein